MAWPRFRRTDDPGDPIVGWFKSRWLRKHVRTTPVVKLGDLAEDTAGHIEAIVVPHENRTVVAPLSALTCVYYVLEIYDGEQLIAHEHEGVPFKLEQDGAHAFVDLEHAFISVDYQFTSSHLGPFDANPEQRALLEKHDLLKRSWFNTDRLVYRQGAITPGDRIAVLGTGTREPDPDGGGGGIYRDAGPTRLRLRGSQAHPLVISKDQVRVHF